MSWETAINEAFEPVQTEDITSTDRLGLVPSTSRRSDAWNKAFGYESGIDDEDWSTLVENEFPEPPKTGMVRAAGRGLTHGVLGLAETTGTALEYFGQRFDSKGMVEAGQTAKEYWKKKAEPFGPPAEIANKNVWDNPELLANASWWAYNVAEMMPAFAAMMVPAAGVEAAMVKIGTKLAPFSSTALERLFNIGRKVAVLGTGGTVGGGFEGMSTYNQVLESGGSEKEAARAAEFMTIGAGVLNAIGIDKILGKAGAGFKAKIIKMLGAGVWEGLTEGAEEPTEVISKVLAGYLEGKPIPDDIEQQLIESLKDAITVAPVAAVTGVGGSIFHDIGTKKSTSDPVKKQEISDNIAIAKKKAAKEIQDEILTEETFPIEPKPLPEDKGMRRRFPKDMAPKPAPMGEATIDEEVRKRADAEFEQAFAEGDILTTDEAKETVIRAEKALKKAKREAGKTKDWTRHNQLRDAIQKARLPNVKARKDALRQLWQEYGSDLSEPAELRTHYIPSEPKEKEYAEKIRGYEEKAEKGPPENAAQIGKEDRGDQFQYAQESGRGPGNEELRKNIGETEGLAPETIETPFGERFIQQSGKWFNPKGEEVPYSEIEKKLSKEIAPEGKEAKTIASAIDVAAKEAATSPENDLPEPTEAQKEAGNYKKAHVSMQGMDITIENPRGSERSGTDKSGKKWKITLGHHYGYFKRSEGKDGEQIDVFIGPEAESEKAYVIDQVDPETGKFDEHKALLGFKSKRDARRGYLANYEKGWKGLGAITEVSIDDFKKWIGDGKRKKEPFSKKPGKDTEPDRRKEIKEAREGSEEKRKGERRDVAVRKEIDTLSAEEKEFAIPELRRMLDIQKKSALRQKRIANLDPLTRLKNRRGLAKETAKRKKEGKKTYHTFIDLIGFKGLNDFIGHEAGDETLRFIARAMKAVGLEGATRWGGDELLFQADSVKAGEEGAQKLHEYFENNPLGLKGPDGKRYDLTVMFRHGTAKSIEEADAAAGAKKAGEPEEWKRGKAHPGLKEVIEEAPKTEEPIEVSGEKDKIVSVDMPEAKAEDLTPKQQKEYLLAEIDKAISDKDEKTEYYTFEVPGDGEFSIPKNQLDEFKRRVKRLFPSSLVNRKFKPRSIEQQPSEIAKYKKIINTEPSNIKPDDIDKIFKAGAEAEVKGSIKSFNIFQNWLLSEASQDTKDAIKKAISKDYMAEAKAELTPSESLTFTKRKDAPIADYTSKDGKYRIYKSEKYGWTVQDLTGKERENITTGETSYQSAKDWLASHIEKKPAEKIEDFGEKIWGARKDTAERKYAKPAKPETEKVEPWRKKFVVMEKVDGSGWTIGKKGDKYGLGTMRGQVFATEKEAEQAIPIFAVAQNHFVYKNKDGEFEIFKRVGKRKRFKIVNKTFPSREEGMKYMAQHAEEILNTKTTFGEEILPIPEIAVRTGEQRRETDATPEMFMETFEPRGIEFGNWNNQEERQQVLNHAYDGLLDLAEVLNVPPKALMLNGELAIAFGARGQGLSGAKAHYEPSYGVINLTKMKGAGSLAHEWFHALDHYLARQDTKASSEKETNERGDLVYKTKSNRYDFQSYGKSYQSKVRPELQEAYDNIINTMYKKAKTYVEDMSYAEKFLGKAKENLRSKLDAVRSNLEKDLTDTYSWRKNKRGLKPASAEQLTEFDNLADTLVEGGNLETKWIYDEKSKSRSFSRKGRHSNETVESISKILKTVRNRNGFDSQHQRGALDEVVAAMQTYSDRLNLFEDAAKGTEKTKKVPTSYAVEAKKMDQARTGDYWSEPHEMAARAFSAYVEDKISEQGNQSDFIVYHAHGGILLPMIDGFVARPYPEGQERVDINKAFDNFVKALKTKETKKGVELYSAAETAGRTEVDQVMDIVMPYLKGMTNFPVVRVVQSVENLPKNLIAKVQSFSSRVNKKAEGFYDTKSDMVYLVADNLSPGRVEAVLRHEAEGHRGIRLLMGTELDPFLDSLAKAKRKDLKRADPALNFNDQDAVRVAADEWLARKIEDGTLSATWWDRLVRAFKKWVRNFIPNLKLTDLEIRAVLTDTVRNVREGRIDRLTPGRGRVSYSDIAEKWYSKMIRVLSEKLPGKGEPLKFAKLINVWANKGEFKKEELQWSGVLDWLREQSGKVTKQNVLNYLDENNVRVEEVEKTSSIPELQWKDAVKGGKYTVSTNNKFKIEHLPNGKFLLHSPVGLQRITNDIQEAKDIADQHNYNSATPETKFSDPKLRLPGGKRYRELLLALPGKPFQQYDVKFDEKTGEYFAFDKSGKEIGRNKYHSDLISNLNKQEGDKFKSSHWEEPNVLAHIRFDERTVPNGEKVLHISEIQSDWLQTGRKEGFRLSFDKWLDGRNKTERRLYKEGNEETIKFLKRRYDQYRANTQAVPDAPFKKTWPLLTIKRMVRYASENGFDTVSWDTGEVQGDRYDLSKQVSSIIAFRNDDGTFNLSAKPVEMFGMRTQDIGYNITPEKLQDYVGKDLAEKIVDQTDSKKEYSGLDLKVGAEGMKGFYDKILPAEVNKFFGKKAWGNAKVGETELSLPSKYPGLSNAENVEEIKEGRPSKAKVWSLPITPEMKQKALGEGMPLFQMGDDRSQIKVVKISGKEFSEETNIKKLRPLARKYAKDHLQGKIVTNKDSGWKIEVAGQGLKHAISFAKKNYHLQSIAGVPGMLENAVKISTEPHRGKDRNIPWVHQFIAPLRIGENFYRVKLTVRETLDGRKYYNHHATEIEKPPVLLSGEQAPGSRLSDDLSYININDLLQDVNGKLLFSFAGEKARTADTSLLHDAQIMFIKGTDPETIREKTGWMLGYDDKWKFEIDDSHSNLDTIELDSQGVGEKNTFLINVLDHDELYKAYPELGSYKINIMIDPSWFETGGSHTPRLDRDLSLYPGLIRIKATNIDQARNILLHEVQHAIQSIEGFATGTNLNVETAEKYKRSAGEIEARETGLRANLDVEQRKFAMPYLGGIPKRDVIVKFQSDYVESAYVPDEETVKRSTNRFVQNAKLNQRAFFNKTSIDLPSNDPKDLIKGIRWLQTMQDMAKNFPGMKRLFDVEKKRVANSNAASVRDRETTDAYFTMDKASTERVNAALFAGDENSEVYSDKQLKEEFGLNADEISGYKAVRKALEEKLDDHVARILADVIDTQRTPITPELINDVKKAKSEEELKDVLMAHYASEYEASKLPWLINWIKEFQGYVPHTWDADWLVKVVVEKDKDEYMFEVPSIGGKAKPTRAGRLKSAKKLAYQVVKEKLNLSDDEIGEMAKNNQIVVVRSRDLPIDLFEGARMDVIQSIINDAQDKMWKETVQYMTKDQAKKFEDMQDILKEHIQEMYLAKGWGRHLMGRRGVKGYRTDLKNVISGYLIGANKFTAKGIAAKEFSKAMKDISPTQTPEQWKHGKQYVSDMLGSTAEAGWFKKIAGTWFLAGDLSAAVLNMTQNWTHAVPMLRSIKPKKDRITAEKEIFRAMKDIAAEYAATRGKDKKIFSKASEHISQEEIDALKRAYNEGHLDPAFLGETTGYHASKIWDNYSKKAWGVIFKLFTGAEGWNRTSTYLASFRRARRAGMSIDDAVSKANDVVEAAHFVYGKGSRPQLVRATGAIGNIAYTFMTYPLNNLVFLKHRIEDVLMAVHKGDKQAVKDSMKVIGSNLAYVFAFGGLLGLPFSYLAQAILNLFDDDEEDWEVLMRKHMPKTIGRAVTRGIPAAFLGNDMSWRVQGTDVIGMPIGFQIVGMGKKRLETAYKIWERGDETAAFFYLMPDMVRNPYRAVMGYREGGTRIGVAPIKYTAGEAITKTLSFTPTREAEAWKASEVTRNARKLRLENLANYAERYLRARKDKDREAVIELRSDIREYNRRQKEKNRKSLRISWKDVTTSAKQRRKYRGKSYREHTPKYMRRYQKRVEETLGLE